MCMVESWDFCLEFLDNGWFLFFLVFVVEVKVNFFDNF